MNRRLILLFVILASIVGPSIARYHLSDIHSSGTWMLARMVVIMRLDSIGFGVLLAYVMSFAPATYKRWQASRYLPVAGIAFFYFLFWVIFKGGQYINFATFTNMLFFPLSSICVMLTLPAMGALKIREGIVKKGVTFVSKISYSTYLVNYSIVVQLIKATSYSENYAPALYAIYGIATIGLSILMYRYIEKPFLAFREKYFNDRPTKMLEGNVYAVDI